MIEFTEVTKRYGAGGRSRVEALAAVSLRFAGEETVGIVGPNGAGKSTLLGLVLGFLRPSAGEVTIAGISPRDWVRRNGAAFLPERFAVPPEWPVSAALRAFARLECDAPVAAARDALERFGLGPFAARPAGTLSRGLLQRLGLAQAMLAHRELVVLDEPTEGLDPRGRLLLRETLAGLHARGATVLLASHDLTEIERVADRAVLLDGGHVRESFATRATGEPDLYAIRLAAPMPDLVTLFPGATEIDPAHWVVRVTGAADLTARLAALIDAGAVIAEVAPASATLEERVRASLDDTRRGDGEAHGPAPAGGGAQ